MSYGECMRFAEWRKQYDTDYEALSEAFAEIERLRAENEKMKASFNPDWDMREAAMESLREHQQIAREAQQERDQLKATVVNLRGQLNNCVGHLNRASRWFRNDTDYQGAMEAANNAIYRTPAQNLGDHNAEAINIARARTRQAWISSNSAEEYDFALAKYANQLRTSASAEEVKS